MSIETIEKIKKAVHQPIDFKDFESTCVRENTNCFALAIGSTITADKTFYRPGRLSGKKPLEQDFFSVEEVKNLFLTDLKALELEYEPLNLFSKKQILEYTCNLELKDNEHIVVMFVQEMANKSIMDFHFLRYDNRGWSEKRGFSYFFTGKNVSWPSNWYDKLVGCFKITC